MSRSVIVLGQHRSGTSAVASILHHLGIPMGTPGNIESATHLVDGWPAFESNPRGQFEDNDFVKIFDDGHGSWECPVWWRYSTVTAQRAKSLVRKREYDHELWGLKSPQLCYTLTYLLDYLKDPVVIAIHRDFDDMVASLSKRDGRPLPVSQHIQALYYTLFMGAKVEVREKGVPLLGLEFEEVLEHPQMSSNQIANFIDRPFGIELVVKAAASIQTGGKAMSNLITTDIWDGHEKPWPPPLTHRK